MVHTIKRVIQFNPWTDTQTLIEVARIQKEAKGQLYSI